jgi:SAM-dependent methyltransferase
MSTVPPNHWDKVYREKGPAQTSWFREHLDASLRLIDGLHLPGATSVIDVGGGRATLVDDLLARGYLDVTVLDLAEPALRDARERLKNAASSVTWLVDDITNAKLPEAHFGLWHDRAVFHFLVDADARTRYVAQAAHAVRPGGYVIVATFATDGPERCSGLPVQRYDATALAAEFAPFFEHIDEARDEHATPWGATQPFTYVVLRRTDHASQ